MYSWGCATSCIWVGIGSSTEPYDLFTASVVLPALSGPVPAVDIGYTWELGAGIGLNEVSGSVCAVYLGNRHVCTTGIVLHQVFGSIYAVAMGNRHVCTVGVALHQVFGSILVVILNHMAYLQLALCYLRYRAGTCSRHWLYVEIGSWHWTK